MTSQIITFYSPTGGDYRSVCLVNLAWSLAATGKRVLLVDWDFERPILHRHLRRFLVDKELGCSEGLVDMLWEFMEAAMTPVPAEQCAVGWHSKFAEPDPYTCGVVHRFPDPGYLGLMPAGKLNQAYAHNVTALNWERFYTSFGGGNFFEAMKKQLRAEYDYVLINGAPGFSEITAPPVIQMPDTLVVFSSPDAEGRDTLGAVVRSVEVQRQAMDLLGCRIIPVDEKVRFQPRFLYDGSLIDRVPTDDITRRITTAIETSA